MIIDAHTHYGPQCGITIADELIIEGMDRFGIDRAVMSSTIAISGDDRDGNNGVLGMMRSYPDRIAGYCVPNPFRNPEQELSRCVDLGFSGVKLHPYWMGCPLDNRMLWPMYEIACKLRMPILFHSGGSLTSPDFRFTTPQIVIEVAHQFPEAHFIVGHMGLERWLDLVNVAAEAKNVYLDITMSMPNVERVETAVHAVGVERVLFGSDMPHLNPAVPLGLIEECNLTRQDKALILGGNMERILNQVAKQQI